MKQYIITEAHYNRFKDLLPVASPAWVELVDLKPIEPLTDAEILVLEKETPVLDDAGEEWIYFARAIGRRVLGGVE